MLPRDFSLRQHAKAWQLAAREYRASLGDSGFTDSLVARGDGAEAERKAKNAATLDAVERRGTDALEGAQYAQDNAHRNVAFLKEEARRAYDEREAYLEAARDRAGLFREAAAEFSSAYRESRDMAEDAGHSLIPEDAMRAIRTDVEAGQSPAASALSRGAAAAAEAAKGAMANADANARFAAEQAREAYAERDAVREGAIALGEEARLRAGQTLQEKMPGALDSVLGAVERVEGAWEATKRDAKAAEAELAAVERRRRQAIADENAAFLRGEKPTPSDEKDTRTP
jgi:hypothetical protein